MKICRKCKKTIDESRQPYRHIGKPIYIDGDYIYKAYQHVNCDAPLLPKPKSMKSLCQTLNKEIK